MAMCRRLSCLSTAIAFISYVTDIRMRVAASAVPVPGLRPEYRALGLLTSAIPKNYSQARSCKILELGEVTIRTRTSTNSEMLAHIISSRLYCARNKSETFEATTLEWYVSVESRTEEVLEGCGTAGVISTNQLTRRCSCQRVPEPEAVISALKLEVDTYCCKYDGT